MRQKINREQRREPNRPFARRCLQLVRCGIPVLVLLWLAGDFVVSRIVAGRVARWEATVSRDDEGIQIGAASRSIAGGPVGLLLVHGFNDTPEGFAKMAAQLSHAGYTIRLVRLPGFGVAVREMNDCNWQQWLQSVRDETFALRQQCQHVFLIGHSLGGAVTTGVVIDNPDIAEGIVLLAPAVEVSSRRSPIFPTRFWQWVGHRLLLFTTIYESPFDRNDARDPDVRNPACKPAFSTRNIVQQSMQLMAHNRNRAAAIRIPLLMVLTRDDQVVDWVASERYFHSARSAMKRLLFFDTSGHAMNVDRDWPAITEQIVTFVQQVVEP